MATLTAVNVVDGGTVIEWWPLLANPANTVRDEVGSGVTCPTNDRDCRPLTGSEDLRRCAWTSDATRVYFYLERQATVAATASYLIYLDEDSDGLMESAERVLRVNWTNGRALQVDLLGYQSDEPTGDPMTSGGLADGYALPGSVPSLGAPDAGGPPTCSNCGSLDGRTAEFAIPWTAFKRGGTPRGFTYHVSSTSSLAGLSTAGAALVRDNLGGSALNRGVAVDVPMDSRSVAPGGTADPVFVIVQKGNFVGAGGSGDYIAVAAHSEQGLALEIRRDTATGTRLGLDANGDGDFEDPDDVVDVDGDMDGMPDLGVRLAPGASQAVTVVARIPATAVGLVDHVRLLAWPAAAPERLEQATVAVHAGPITLETDSVRAAAPGQSAGHYLVVANHGTASATVDFSAAGTLSYSFVTDAGGAPGSALGDSNANGQRDLTVGPGSQAKLWMLAALPGTAVAGTTKDTATVTATLASMPSITSRVSAVTEAFQLLHVRLAHDGPSARGILPAAPGGLLWFAHELVNAGPATQEVFLSAQVVSGQLEPPVLVSDPNGDGNPEDGQVLDFSVAGIQVPGRGGRLPFLAVTQVRATAAAGSALDVRVRVDTLSASASQVDMGRTQSGVPKLTTTFEVQAPAFGPCRPLQVEFGPPASGAPSNVAWTAPSGSMSSQARWTDGWGTTRDAKGAAAANETGDWSARFAGQTVSLEVERRAVVQAPVVTLSNGGTRVSVTAAISNQQAIADIQEALVVSWILSRGQVPANPGGSVLLSNGATSRTFPHDGMLPTHVRPLPLLQEGSSFSERFALQGVDWGAGPADFTAFVQVVDACGTVLGTASTDFSGIPSGGAIDLLRNADVPTRTFALHASLLTPQRDPVLDPVRDLHVAGVGALTQVSIPGDGVLVGTGTPGVLIFYEVSGRPGPLRVARTGTNIVLSGW